jgi:hypothetical protein
VNRTLVRFTTALALANLVGCTTWTATKSPLVELDGRKARLTTRDGNRFEGLLLHPDTLGPRILLLECDATLPLVIDTSTIVAIEKRGIHEGHTVGLALLCVGAIVTTIGQIWLSFQDPDY